MSNITPHKIAILVTSCDKYKDLWKPFFTLFFRYWQGLPVPIYLGTNHLIYDDKRVKTITTSDDNWSSRFLFQNLGFKGENIIYDLPVFSQLQTLYLEKHWLQSFK